MGSTIQSQVCLPFGAPTLLSPAQDYQTDDSSVTLTGNADAGATVEAIDNGNGSGVTTADNTGAYSLSVPLVYGPNVLQVSVRNVCDTIKDSNSVTVTRPRPVPPPSGPSSEITATNPTVSSLRPVINPATPPASPSTPAAPSPSYAAPVLLEPTSNTVVEVPYVTAIGKEEPGLAVQLDVNGHIVAQVITNTEGIFSARLPLASGVNRIQASITTVDGVRASTVVTVSYVPPASHEGGRLWEILIIGATGILLYCIEGGLYLLIRRMRGEQAG